MTDLVEFQEHKENHEGSLGPVLYTQEMRGRDSSPSTCDQSACGGEPITNHDLGSTLPLHDRSIARLNGGYTNLVVVYHVEMLK